MTDQARHHPGTPGAGRQWPGRTGDADDLPLSAWATAQRDARAQRAGRYPPAALAHPGKMLPAIAATAITRYTAPGDLVADPMCGIGTTLIEAVDLGRDGIGVEYQPAGLPSPPTGPRWPGLSKRPTEYFKSNFFVAFRGDEPTMKAALDIVGDNNFLWDTDYPHPDGTFPWGIDALLKQSIPYSSKKKILWDNATRAFGFN